MPRQGLAQFPSHDFKVSLRRSKSNEKTCPHTNLDLLIYFPGPKLQAGWFQSSSSKATKDTCVFLHQFLGQGRICRNSSNSHVRFLVSRTSVQLRLRKVAKERRKVLLCERSRHTSYCPLFINGNLVRKLPSCGRMSSGSLRIMSSSCQYSEQEQCACGSSRGE